MLSILLRSEKEWNWQLMASDVIILGVTVNVIPAVTSDLNSGGKSTKKYIPKKLV